MYNLASTSKQSVLDLINSENNTKYTLSQMTIALPSDSAGSGFVPTLPETNTVIELTNVEDPTDKVTIGYHRIDGNTAFGTDPSVPVVLAGKSNNDIIGAVLTHIRTVWGMPLEAGTYTAVKTGQTVVITFDGHYVLKNVSTILLTELTSLTVVWPTLISNDHFTKDDTFVGATSADVLLALVNATNGTSLTLSDVTMDKPSAVGGATPSDSTTFTGVSSAGYGDKVSFAYSRLNIEELSPDGIQLESFDTFTLFYNTVTPAYMATLLTQVWGFPVQESEIRVRNQTNNVDNFTARVSIVDNYVARSAGGITVTSAKTVS